MNGTTDVAFLKTDGNVYFVGGFTPGGWNTSWLYGGGTQMTQVTDADGRPAALWLQNGQVQEYNGFVLDAAGNGPATLAA